MTEIRKLFPYLRPYFPLLVLALILLVFTGVLETVPVTLLSPLLNQWSGEGAEAAASAEGKFAFLHDWLGLQENPLSRIAYVLLGFAFLKGLFLYCAEYAMGYIGHRVVAALRNDLYRHLLEQSLAFFARNTSGRLMVRVVSDTERLQIAVSRILTDFLRQIFLFLCFLGLVMYTDWKLALLSFLAAPLVLSIILNLGRKIRIASLWSQEHLEEISRALQEVIAGNQIVKAFTMEDYEKRRFRELNQNLVRVNLKAARIGALNSPLIEFIGYVSFFPFLLYAHHQMNQGFTIGVFAVFMVALFRLYEPVRKLSRMHLHFQHSSASAGRIFDLLATHMEIPDLPEAQTLAPLSREIAFEGVSFSYEDGGESAILQDLDLSIGRGEIVALVGPSGAGKSSMVSLIPRFFDVTSGRITIDGVDIREARLESLRDQVAIVTQDTFLFNDSVVNNIGYGRENCSTDEIEEAARAAFIHDVIEALPRGYNTVIGERGQQLSGGQRQRIAIARAILKQAPILILDEATSALDTESEKLVQNALQNLMENRTTLVIAHRLSTVRKADRIVLLDAGRIIDIGDHQGLLNRSLLYRRLSDAQSEKVEGRSKRSHV